MANASDPGPPLSDEQTPLVGFFYAIPIGLAQLGPFGDFEIANPQFASLVQGALVGAALHNFFELLEALAPALRAKVAASPREAATLLDDELIALPDAAGGAGALACTLTRAKAGGFMVVLRDASQRVQREAAPAR